MLGFQAAGKTTVWDDHKARLSFTRPCRRTRALTRAQKTGVVLLALYLVQCTVGALIHYLAPKTPRARPPQNYFHAVLGLTIIALSMYQIRTGYREEWPNYSGLAPVPNGINILWMVWCIVRASLPPLLHNDDDAQ